MKITSKQFIVHWTKTEVKIEESKLNYDQENFFSRVESLKREVYVPEGISFAQLLPFWNRKCRVTIEDFEHHSTSSDLQLYKLIRILQRVDCSCTVAERNSGHVTGCYMPAIAEALAE